MPVLRNHVGRPGDRHRPRSQRLARPAGRARRGALPDRRLEPGLDFGRRVQDRGAILPARLGGPRIRPGGERQGFPRPRQQGPAPIRCHDPHPQGPPGGRQPRVRPPAGHVRGSGGSGDASGRHRRPRGRRGGFRRQEDGVRGQGRRGLRTAQGRDRLARRRPGRDRQGTDARGEDRRLGHFPDRLREPDEGGGGRDLRGEQRGSRLRDGRGSVQGEGERADERVPRADLLLLRPPTARIASTWSRRSTPGSPARRQPPRPGNGQGTSNGREKKPRRKTSAHTDHSRPRRVHPLGKSRLPHRTRHDQPDHRVLRQEQVHRLPPGGRRRDPGLVVHAAHAAGRHPGPQRHPGHHLLPLGPQPRHRRGPGHLPHRHRHAGRAQGQGRARLLRFRLLLRLRHLRGRHRHLLGPLAHPGVSLRGAAPPSRRASRPSWDRTPPASAGSSSTRWWTPPASTAWRTSAPTRTGICAPT